MVSEYMPRLDSLGTYMQLSVRSHLSPITKLLSSCINLQFNQQANDHALALALLSHACIQYLSPGCCEA
eukprot:1372678-Pleurochrysis_carterae.AAC.1